MDMYISHAEHDEAMRRLDAENDRQNHRLNTLEKTVDQIHALTVSVEKLAASVERMTKEQVEQSERLKAIENRDGEMWRKAIGYILMAVAGAVVTFLFTRLGIV